MPDFLLQPSKTVKIKHPRIEKKITFETQDQQFKEIKSIKLNKTSVKQQTPKMESPCTPAFVYVVTNLSYNNN